MSYDQVGNVLAISDGVAGNRGDRDMGYDGLNRLTSAISPMFGTATYAYDVQDNLSHVAVTGGSQIRDQDYCYDASNRLTNIKTGGCSAGSTVVGLGYDVQGNLANKNGVLYGFDYGNRLRSGGPETYRYDAYGRRTRSINSTGGIVYSLYGQGGQLLWQRDQRTNQRRNYVYLQGSLLAEHRRPIGSTTETIVYQHTDALGSPVATTNSAKTVLQRSEYEPYGYLLSRTMEDGPGYTGHVTDAATGLVYMQQRYYDPLIGSFLSGDAVTTYSSGNVKYFVRYAYGFNNPYAFTDADGRAACPGRKESECIQSDTYVASRSNGQTTQVSDAIAGAMLSHRAVVAVPLGGKKEKIAFVKGDGEGGHKVELAQGATTSGTTRTESAKAAIPEGAEAVLHGRIDGKTDGFVSPNDAAPLKSGLPNGVVSEHRVGVTEIVNGQLQFRVLDGAMTPREIKELQRSLDNQQRQFMTPRP